MYHGNILSHLTDDGMAAEPSGGGLGVGGGGGGGGGGSLGGLGSDSPGAGKSAITPFELRRFVESKRFHIVANLAMEPSWLTGGFTDMHVHLKEEMEEGGGFSDVPFGERRSRDRALSYVF